MLGGGTDRIPPQITRDTDGGRWLTRRAGYGWRRGSEGVRVVAAGEHGGGCEEDGGHVPVFFDTPPLTITTDPSSSYIYTLYLLHRQYNPIHSFLVAGAGVFAVFLLPCRTRFLFLCLLFPWFSCLGFFAMVGILW